MVARLDKIQLLARDEIVAPPAQQDWQDYSFELPPALYLITGVLFLGFVSVLSLAFANPEMAVPFGVFAVFIIAFFAVPAVFVRCAPDGCNRARRWTEFLERGVAIEHGRCSGLEAAVLVLMLPAFIFCWGLAIAVIVALL